MNVVILQFSNCLSVVEISGTKMNANAAKKVIGTIKKAGIIKDNITCDSEKDNNQKV